MIKKNGYKLKSSIAKIGDTKLKEGDCLSLLPSLEDASVDMILSDLPYGTTQNVWDNPIDLQKLFFEMFRVIKDNGAIVLFGSMPFTAEMVIAGKKHFKYSLIWSKNKSTGFLNAKKMPLRAHEDLLVFYKKTPVYNPQKSTGHKPMNAAYRTGHGSSYNPATRVTKSDAGTTERFPTSIIAMPVLNNDSNERIHSAQKPIPLLRLLIKTYTNADMVVLDVTMGSGSTGVAARLENRKFIGFELCPDTFKKAKTWIESTDSESEEK